MLAGERVVSCRSCVFYNRLSLALLKRAPELGFKGTRMTMLHTNTSGCSSRVGHREGVRSEKRRIPTWSVFGFALVNF